MLRVMHAHGIKRQCPPNQAQESGRCSKHPYVQQSACCTSGWMSEVWQRSQGHMQLDGAATVRRHSGNTLSHEAWAGTKPLN